MERKAYSEYNSKSFGKKGKEKGKRERERERRESTTLNI